MKKVLLYVILLIHFYCTSFCSDSTATLDAYLTACTQLGYFSGSVLIAKEGTILLSKGYGFANHEHAIANTPQTKFKISSLAKPFIALAIMQLHEKGLLNVHDPLSNYIPDYPRGNEITIHHILTHTSGIKNYTAFPDFSRFKKLPTSLDNVIAQFKHLGLASDLGKTYKFSNSNYALLCFIIEIVTGIPYYHYIHQHIFTPAGMIASGYDDHPAIIPCRAGYSFNGHQLMNADYNDASAVVGLGSFYSTVEDLYRFHEALHSTLLASHQSLNTMFMPYAQIGNKEDAIMYGYGWATITLAGQTVKKHIAGIDGFSAAMYRFADANIFIVVLSNFQHALTEPMSFDLAAILCNQPYEIPVHHTPVSIDSHIYDTYVGTYEYKGLLYKIVREHDTIYFKQPDKEMHALIPESPTDFFIKGIPITIRFIKNDENMVDRMVTKAFGKERLLFKQKNKAP